MDAKSKQKVMILVYTNISHSYNTDYHQRRTARGDGMSDFMNDMFNNPFQTTFDRSHEEFVLSIYSC